MASDGSVEQWGGLQTPRGFLLRWFHPQELGFPDHGYDVYRATVVDFRPLPWHEAATAMDGQTHYEHAINGVREVTLSCEQGFRFASPSVWGSGETSDFPHLPTSMRSSWSGRTISSRDRP